MEMVMKFPNGETPNLLIEVFNYNPVCALQICYTSGFGRHRHGYGFVTENMDKSRAFCQHSHVEINLHRPSAALVGEPQPVSVRKVTLAQTTVVQRWQRRWDPADKALIQRLLFQRFLAPAVYMSKGPPADIELQIASNSMSGVCDWVWTVTSPEEQAGPTVRACDFWTLPPNIWKGVLNAKSRNHGHLIFWAISSLFCWQKQIQMFFLLSRLETHWFFQCLWWSQEYFSPVWHKHSA